MMNLSDDVPCDPAAPDEKEDALLLWSALRVHADLGPLLVKRLALQRQRLALRAVASTQATRHPVTTRYAPPAMARANALARLQTLYLAAEGTLRPGEPLNVLLIELAPGGGLSFDGAAPDVLREWLLVRGSVRLSSPASGRPVELAPLDYHIAPAPHRDALPPDQLEAGPEGVLLFLRESRVPPGPRETVAHTVRDAETPWNPFGPRIERRVLWRSDQLAALLYRMQPGASVPPHGHGHDEECLVLRGETRLDDVLLREGDYQLAPAGSSHAIGSSSIGSIFYIHGDLNLSLLAPAEPA